MHIPCPQDGCQYQFDEVVEKMSARVTALEWECPACGELNMSYTDEIRSYNEEEIPHTEAVPKLLVGGC